MCVSVCLASVRLNVSLIVYVCLSILLHPWKRHLAETKTEDNWVCVEIYRSYFWHEVRKPRQIVGAPLRMQNMWRRSKKLEQIFKKYLSFESLWSGASLLIILMAATSLQKILYRSSIHLYRLLYDPIDFC